MKFKINRSYTKPEPHKDAKLVIIYCEGEKREYDYFDFFTELSPRIKFEVVPSTDGESSPDKLLEKANIQILEENIYILEETDEVWFVIDTDRWGSHIDILRKECYKHDWNIAQSNPCFEVWLYYHFQKLEVFEEMEKGKSWKSKVHEITNEGFNSSKHPNLIKNAIQNAKEKYEEEGNIISIGCSEVFMLAESFYPFIKEQLEE